MSVWWPVVAAGVLVAWLLWSGWQGQRTFARGHDTFRCRVRLRSAELPGFSPTWSRGVRHARWVHDVLVIRAGWLRPRVHLLPVRVAEGELVELDRKRVRGLGPRPLSVRVLLDDQSAIEIAAAGSDGTLLAGPFFVLSVTRLR
jgi:hypothetical protein